MNHTDMSPVSDLGVWTNATLAPAAASPSVAPTKAASTTMEVLTTAASSSSVTALHAVVIVVFLLTVAVAIFLAYRYFCHDKGDYRLSGEVTPWEEPLDPDCTKSSSEKKEYFI